MLPLVNSLAQMTELRDRDHIAESVSGLVSAALNLARLELWEVRSDNPLPAVRLRSALAAGTVSSLDAMGQGPWLPPDAELAECLASRRLVECSPASEGLNQYLFPVVSGSRLAFILRVAHAGRLDETELRTIGGLLRIYQNHLNIVEYSQLDELTGLRNRKTFDDCFQLICADATQAVAGQRQHMLAVIDVDHFKRVNDRYGHLIGDEVLVLLARKMQESFGDTDSLFRFGGEEFVLLMHGGPLAQVFERLQAFRQSIENFAFPQVGRVTVSIGVTAVGHSDNAPNALGRADRALYYAKQNGRNQVSVFELLAKTNLIETAAPALNGFELF